MAAGVHVEFMQAVKFLLFLFRSDCWWWGLVLMLRSMLMALAPVVATDDARIQMFVILFTLVYNNGVPSPLLALEGPFAECV